MNNMIHYIGLLLLALIVAQCTPKTAEVMDAAEPMTEEVVEVMDFRSKPPMAGPAPKINIGRATDFMLDNGLQVIVVENHKIPSVSFQITLKNDQIREYDKVGYVSMAGDLMGRGTTTKSKAEIDEAVDFIGANLSTSGSGMFASSLTKHMPELLGLMTDVLYNPSMPAEELEKIKTQTLSGLEAGKTNPDAISANLRSKIMYGGDHPYGEIQKPENVEAIDIETCKAYVEDFFVPNNAYLVIVGDVTVDQARDLSEKYFGSWERKAFKPVRNKKVAETSDTQVKFAQKDGAVQSVVNVNYPIELKPGAPDVIPARVMNTILGGSATGRLFLNLREDKAYTYGAYSSVGPDRLKGSFNAQASVRNEVTDSSITEILYELERIRTEPVDEEVLQNTKNYMTGSFARALESPQTIASFALSIFRNNLPQDYYETYLEKLNAVTVQDIQSMAQKYLRPEAAYIFVVGSKDDVAESLTKFDADGKVDFYDPFGDPVVIDKTEIPDDLTGTQIVEDYINAIGGQEKLTNLNNMTTVMKMSMMGQEMTITNIYADGKSKSSVGNSQMTFQEQVYDGEKVQMSQMGNKQIITEGPQFEAAKEQSTVNAQMNYLTNGSTIEIKGTETIDGTSCYKLMVMKPTGSKVTEYYSVESSLLVRTIGTAPGPGGEEISITTDLMEYKDYDGILWPSVIVTAGVTPTPMEMKVESIEINSDIDMTMFDIK